MENKRKHIRFDDESSTSNSSSSGDECKTTTSAINKTRTFFNKIKKMNEEQKSIASTPSSLKSNASSSNNKTICTTCLDVILVKNKLKKEKSFGFQLRGDELVKGKHYIENVENNTAASRVGLKKYDKIVKINGVCVSEFFISQVIQQIEYETSLNDYKLHLSVQRGRNMGNSTSNGDDVFNYNNEEMEEDSYYSNNQEIVNSLSQLTNNIEKNQQKEMNRRGSSNGFSSNSENNKTQMTKLIKSDLMSINTSNMVSLSDMASFPSLMMPAAQLEQQASNYYNVLPISQSTLNPILNRQEKIDQIKFIAPKKNCRRPNVPSRIILNNKAKEIQKVLSEQGKYVNWKEVLYELCEMYSCEHIGELDLVHADHLEAINELTRLQKRVDSFIISYENRASCITLVDLEKGICEDYNYGLLRNTINTSMPNSTSNEQKKSKIKRFEELHLGPLIKNQLVRQIFGYPEEITSMKQLRPLKLSEVIRDLCNYLKNNELWSKKVHEKEFETYLLKTYKTDFAYVLSYKISNIGLMVGSLKSVQRLYSDSLKNVRETLTNEFVTMFENEKKFLFNQLNDRLKGYNQHEETLTVACLDPVTKTDSQAILDCLRGQVNSRLNYLSTSSMDIIADFLVLFEKLMNKSDFDYIREFLDELKRCQFLRDCFQLCICLGKSDLDLCLNQMNVHKKIDPKNNGKYVRVLKNLFNFIIEPRQLRNGSSKEFLKMLSFMNDSLKERNLKLVPISYKTFKESENDNQNDDEYEDEDIIKFEDDNQSLSDESHDPKRHISVDWDATNGLDSFLNEKLEANSVINFEQLIKLEKILLSLTRSDLADRETFLSYIFKNKYKFEQKGIGISLIENQVNSKGNFDAYLKSKRKFLLKNCKQIHFNLINTKRNKLSEQEILLKLENLTCKYYYVKKFEDLGVGSFSSIVEEISKENESYDNIIIQESILDHHFAYNLHEEMVDKTELIRRLNECPLLENVYDYLDWGGYSQKFGDLKEFVDNLNEDNSNKNLNINLLELEPFSNRLFKITRNTDIEKLKSSIEQGDYLNAAGHLVSLVSIKYRSLSQIPRSLLINEIESSLSSYLSKSKNNVQLFSSISHIKSEYFNYYNACINQPVCLINDLFFNFLIDFICRIPFKILEQVLYSYIIEPLIKLDGNHRIKQNIFEFLVISTWLNNPKFINDSKINYLIRIGHHCAIDEWSLDNCDLIIKIISGKPSVFDNEKFLVTCSAEKKDLQTLVEEENSVLLNEKKNENELKFDSLGVESSIISLTDQYEHVKSIRESYGIGIELNEQTMSVTKSLKGVIGRSLESLSNELYNKDMHFVLELIQNADDNTYEASTTQKIEPTLVFLIEPSRITLFNNEIGFSSNNIKAICDVKASTKINTRGYIGRKGIGFKSVFTITDTPEIHSNGYHIKFNARSGDIGYILPNWLEDFLTINKIELLKTYAKSKIDSRLMEKIGEFNTCIQLPLKSESEMQRHKSSLLTNNFHDIKPYLLLFLNRLRNLVIINKNDKHNNEFIYHREDRKDLSDNLIEIHSNNEAQKWLVVRESLVVPGNLKPSNDVESTDLCFAFPLDNLKLKKSFLPKMDVFAYLPLRSFGFSFIIQADFVVPASRQDINQDNDWNQWICKQIPTLFIKSLNYFKEHREFETKLEALKSFLRFIPLEEEIIGFFQHVPRQILDLLYNEEFLPAVDFDQETNENMIVWKKPFECVIMKENEIIRQVLTSDLLKKYLGRYYLDSSLFNNNEISFKLLYNLGVRELSLKDVLEILKTVFSSSTEDFKNIKTTAQWLLVLYHCLNNYSLQQEEQLLKQLKQLDFIPILRHGVKKMVSLETCNVFFPTSKLVNVSAKHSTNKIFNLIERDLNLLDVESLLCLDQLKNAQIVSLLKNLGVKQIEPKDVIEFHIIDAFKLNQSNEETLILYMIFIHECYNSLSQSTLDNLKKYMLVLTNRGFKYINETIFLTPTYGNKYDLKLIFSSYSWCLIDSVYFTRAFELKTIGVDNGNQINSKQNRQQQQQQNQNTKFDQNQFMLSWRKFLICLGLTDIFTPKLVQKKIKQSELNDTIYSMYADLLQLITNDECYVFNDFDCDVFNHYMDLTKNLKNDVSRSIIEELTNLYRVLEDNWNQGLKLNTFKYVSVHVEFAKSEHNKSLNGSKFIREELCETIFYRNLKNKKWICAELSEYNESQRINTRIVLALPSDCYVKEQVFLRIYGIHLVCYAHSIPRNKDDLYSLSRDLKFKFEFDITEFLNLFKKWINCKHPFYASISQMKNIYTQISSQLNSYDAKPEIHDQCVDLVSRKLESIIFVPSNLANIIDTKTVENVIEGSFYPPFKSKVYWNDSANIFNKYKSTYLKMPIFLENYYNVKGDQLKFILINDFGIEESPSFEDYLDLLEHVALLASTNKSPYSYRITLNDVYQLYEILIVKCGTSEEASQQLYAQIKNKCVIPCFGNKWLPLENANLVDTPILVDNDFDLAEKFTSKLNMICVPWSDDDNEETFHKMCRAENLTHRVAYFFYKKFNFQSFSQTVYLDLENITENLREAHDVRNLCAKLIPFVQCFLFHRKELQQIYNELKTGSNSWTAHEKLEKMKFYSVRDLQNIYRCKYDPNMSVIVSNKTCLDTSSTGNWKYFVRMDILENEKEIIKGFVKLFMRSPTQTQAIEISDRTEKDLTNFCLLIYQFSRFKINDEDIKDIEKEHQIKLKLPPNEIKWKIPEQTIPKLAMNHVNEEISVETNSNNDSVNKTYQHNNISVNPNPVKTKRQKMLELENISQMQIKDQANSSLIYNGNSGYHAHQNTNSNNISGSNLNHNLAHYHNKINQEKSLQEMNQSLEEMASKTTTNFNIKTFNKFNKTNSSKDQSTILEFGLENWTQNILNNINTIQSSQVEQFENTSSNGNEFLTKIGQWGEMFVFEVLKKLHEEDLSKNLIKIEWMNEAKESGLPYDFRITDLTTKGEMDFDDGQNTQLYIEVKSTSKSSQESFPISYQELAFSHKFSAKFQIYRLYNACSSNPKDVKIKIIENIPNLLYTHDINLFIVI